MDQTQITDTLSIGDRCMIKSIEKEIGKHGTKQRQRQSNKRN